ncbi:hypothetical protein LG329_13760 [Virgibacillus necropolis]|uniref:hypothetical protein n=1 Tax=Virgibacillus necropolis TaxID=163877 RepID=UPI00385092AC
MTPNSTIIKYYQLICEGLFFYFLLVPIMVLYEYPVSVLGYLFTVSFTLLFLSIGMRFIPNYSIYLLSFFILVPFAIYIIQFPPISSVVLIAFMVWRFIVHENEPDLCNQMQLIFYMSLVLMVDVIFFYDTDLIWIALIMLVVMVGGYQLSHIIVEGSIGVKQSLPFIIVFFVSIFTGIVLLFSIVKVAGSFMPYVLNGVLKAVGTGLWWGLDLIGFTGLNIEALQNAIEGIAVQGNTKINMGVDGNRLLTKEQMNQAYEQPDIVNWWTIGISIVILLIIVLFLSRKKLRNQGKDNALERISSESIQGKSSKRQKSKGFFGKFAEKPTNEIRLKVFKFERLTAQKGLGRKQSETIEEWFMRIGIDATYLGMYQKIRYGDSDLTEDEINLFNQQLKEIKTTLNI